MQIYEPIGNVPAERWWADDAGRKYTIDLALCSMSVPEGIRASEVAKHKAAMAGFLECLKSAYDPHEAAARMQAEVGPAFDIVGQAEHYFPTCWVEAHQAEATQLLMDLDAQIYGNCLYRGLRHLDNPNRLIKWVGDKPVDIMTSQGKNERRRLRRKAQA